MQKEIEFVLIRATAAILHSGICKLQAKKCRVAIPLGEHKSKLKKEATFKIFLPSANLILTKACPVSIVSNQTTFSPI